MLGQNSPEAGFGPSPLVVVFVKDSRGVGLAAVVELPARVGKINALPKDVKQFLVADQLGVEVDQNGLAVRRFLGADGLIGRVNLLPTTVAVDGSQNPKPVFKGGFQTPETTAGENGPSGFFWNGFGYFDHRASIPAWLARGIIKGMSQRLVVIDGKSIFYRGYYSMPHLKTSDGRLVGGVYGFTVLALEIINKLQPDYVCVAWDKSKTNIRRRRLLYPAYKANRQPAPADFYDQIPILFKLLAAFNWPLYELDDYEADDLMATLAAQASTKPKLETCLISSDLDLLQALGENIKIYIIRRGFSQIKQFAVDDFETEYKIKLKQFVDLKALMGDSSDNIPGVAGIGRQGAAQLLATYANLEDIYDHLADIKPGLQKKLAAGKEMAFLSRQLVTLSKTAPLKLDLAAMEMTSLDKDALETQLRDLEFFSLLKRLPRELANGSGQVIQSQAGLRTPEVISHDGLDQLKNLDLKKPVFCQAYCRGRFGRSPIFLALADQANQLHIFKLKPGEKPPVKSISLYGHQTKATVQALLGLGLDRVTVNHDVQLVAFLLDSQKTQPSLTDLAQTLLGHHSELDDLSPADWLTKAPDIYALVRQIKHQQQADLKDRPDLSRLAGEIEHPLIELVARIERVGIGLDLEILKDLETNLSSKIKDLTKLIHHYAGTEFNIASPAQLSEVLFVKLGLPTKGIKKTRRGYSTDSEQLERLKDYPIVGCLKGWREYTKILNTYVLALPEYYYRGRVHSDLQLTVVPTGRLSSARPNLQNIPVKSEVGRLVRRAFVAGHSKVFVNADYSQFELRLAACLADDSGYDDRLRQRPGHPRPNRQPYFRNPPGSGQPGTTLLGQGHQLRGFVWSGPSGTGPPGRPQPASGPGFH